MTSKMRSQFLMNSAACIMFSNCSRLASIIFLTWQLVGQRSVQIKTYIYCDSNWELRFIMLWNDWSPGSGIGKDLLTETNLPGNCLLFSCCLEPYRSPWWHLIWVRWLRKPVMKEDVVSKVSYSMSWINLWIAIKYKYMLFETCKFISKYSLFT